MNRTAELNTDLHAQQTHLSGSLHTSVLHGESWMPHAAAVSAAGVQVRCRKQCVALGAVACSTICSSRHAMLRHQPRNSAAGQDAYICSVTCAACANAQHSGRAPAGLLCNRHPVHA
jgi:hypothetical protein